MTCPHRPRWPNGHMVESLSLSLCILGSGSSGRPIGREHEQRFVLIGEADRMDLLLDLSLCVGTSIH